MTREELKHIIRASGDVTNQYEFVIVGSQSILGRLRATIRRWAKSVGDNARETTRD